MKTTTEKMLEKSQDIFMSLYHQGLSISMIEEVANNLLIISKEAIDNPDNNIAAISNGRLKLK